MTERLIMKVPPPKNSRKFLRFYQAHRDEHPLPPEWSEDLSRITAYADGSPDGCPELVFTKHTWKGTVDVEVDLHLTNTAEIFITDNTGEGLAHEELADLIHLLLGVHLTEDDGDCDETPAEENDPADRPWVFDFLLSPYPSPDGLSSLEPRG